MCASAPQAAFISNRVKQLGSLVAPVMDNFDVLGNVQEVPQISTYASTSAHPNVPRTYHLPAEPPPASNFSQSVQQLAPVIYPASAQIAPETIAETEAILDAIAATPSTSAAPAKGNTETFLPQPYADPIDSALDGAVDDFSNVSLTDLMTAINPQMLNDLQAQAPRALQLMQAQEDGLLQAPAAPVSRAIPLPERPVMVYPSPATIIEPMPSATASLTPSAPSAVAQPPFYTEVATSMQAMPNASRAAPIFASNGSQMAYQMPSARSIAPAGFGAEGVIPSNSVRVGHENNGRKSQPLPTGVRPAGVLALDPFQTTIPCMESQPRVTRRRTSAGRSKAGRPRATLARKKSVSFDDPDVVAAMATVKAEAMALVSARAQPQYSYVQPVVQHVVAPAPQSAVVVPAQYTMTPAAAQPMLVGYGATRIVPMGGVICKTDPRNDGAAAAQLAQEDEARKSERAERNRHSAAASRERKKQRMVELERRVAALSRRNAELQIEQMDAVRRVIAREKELDAENQQLRLEIVENDMKINKLGEELSSVGLGETKLERARREVLKRPKTWDSSELKIGHQ